MHRPHGSETPSEAPSQSSTNDQRSTPPRSAIEMNVTRAADQAADILVRYGSLIQEAFDRRTGKVDNLGPLSIALVTYNSMLRGLTSITGMQRKIAEHDKPED